MGNRTQMIKDEETLREKIENDFEHNYFVEAGAGAGKTSLVVNRIARQLASGYKPEEIAAITFTNKAAQELRQRISDKVRNLSEKEPLNTNLQAAALNIGKMQISTIHSFCHRILSEHCFEAALRLDFELLEEEDAKKLQEKFFRSWCNEHAAEYRDLTASLPEGNNFSFSQLTQNFQAVCELQDKIFFRYEDINNVLPADVEALSKQLEKAKENLLSDYKKVVEKSVAGTGLDGYRYYEKDIQNVLNTKYQTDELLIKQLEDKKTFPFNKTKVKKPFGSKIDSITDLIQNGISAEIDAYLKLKSEKTGREEACTNTLVLEFVLAARKEYRAQKFNYQITNDAILQKTNILLENDIIAEKVREMFRCIYIDEFQDTDPVQNSLILRICQKNGEFIPGKMFIVGDVKQSIYRFREADYRLFNATKNLFEQNPATCRVKELNINNRSNSSLVEFINRKVKGIGLVQKYQDMIPRNDSRSEGVLCGVYKVVTNKPEGNDFAQVVYAIKSLVNKADIETFDDVEKRIVRRKAEYRDFLILTEKKVRSKGYIDALQNAGIPCRIAVEYIPGEMIPLKRFALMYRSLSIPQYGRGLEGILETAQNTTSGKLCDNAKKLQTIRDQVRNYSAAQLAGWLLEHAELYLYNDCPIKGHLIKRYQMAVRQMVDSVLSTTENNVLSITQALMDYIDKNNKCEREISHNKTENAVRFMNIHKAKGLEGNIVIIARREGVSDKAETYINGNDRYQVVSKKLNDSGTYYRPYVFNPAVQKAANEERDKESDRKEYVAVTRAKEALIFLDSEAKKNEIPQFSNYVDDSIPELYDSFPLEDTGEESLPLEAIETGILHSEIPGEEVTRRAGYKISPSEMENKSGGKKLEKKSEDQETEDPDDTEAPAETEASELLQKRPASDIFGTVMHRAFELSVHGIREGFVDPDLCINRAINENSDNIDARYKDKASDEKREYQQYLKERLPVFMKFITPFVTGADEVYTEYPFSMTVTGAELGDIRSKLQITEKLAESLPAEGTENDNSLWINGQADLVLKNGTDVVIWDYKSDKMNGLPIEEFSRHIHEKYDNQMNLYKWVFGKIFGGEAEGKFYSVEAGEI